MTQEELLRQLYDFTLVGNGPEVLSLTNAGLEMGLGPETLLYDALIPSLEEVGARFERGDFFVPEMLIAGKAMAGALEILRPLLAETGAQAIGTIVMGTVKGDVHDIGKNLVEIILSNNGYDVVNLGIKVPPEQLIEAYHRERGLGKPVDAIGLSGLLVKSAGQMAITAGDLREAGIGLPLLVGGAALSDRFTRTRIAPEYGGAVCYAKDAMSGLALMNALMDPAQREAVVARHAPEAAPAGPSAAAAAAAQSTARSRKVRTNLEIPRPASLARVVRDVPQLSEIWSYINPLMLYRHHLGFKDNFERALAERDPRALELHEQVEELKADAAQWMKVRVVWQFFEAEPEGNAIHFFEPGAAKPRHTFQFERQRRSDGLCLADYVLAPKPGQRDHVAAMVVTAGAGVRERAEAAKQQARYVYSHGVQVLALETAEAAAEWLHRRIREDWGFADPPEMTMKERFTSRYRGKRYAFGYPACPRIEDQAGVWELLKPQEIGVTLTEGMMMEPEASTSALVFHHPDCSYFSVSDEAAGRVVSREAMMEATQQ